MINIENRRVNIGVRNKIGVAGGERPRSGLEIADHVSLRGQR